MYITYRSGTINATGDRYNYSAERRVEILPVKKKNSVWNFDIDAVTADKRVAIISGCQTDSVTDERSCYMNFLPELRKGGIRATIDSRGKFLSACVNTHDYPGRSAVIRIDKLKPITTNKKGCIGRKTASKLEKQILSGSTMLTRYAEWPYGYEDTTVLIGGSLSSVQSLIQWANSADMSSLFKKN